MCSPRFQSMSTIDGDIRSLDVDFEGAAADARIDADEAVRDLGLSVAQSDYSSMDLRHLLAAELSLVDAAQRRFQQQMRENSLRNMKALEASVGRWELAHTLAVGTRDAAVIVLAVGGTLMTGGAGAAYGSGIASMLGSNLLDNIGKMQDKPQKMSVSETVGKVTAMTAVDFTFDVITFGVGKGIQTGSKVVKQAVVIVIKTAGGTLNALFAAEPGLNGKAKSPGDALSGAYVDAVLDGGIGALMDSRYGKGASKLLRRTIVPGITTVMKGAPIKVRAASGMAVNAKAAKTMSSVAKVAAQKTAEILVGNPSEDKTGSLVRSPICTGAANHAARLAALFPSG